jgi:hypothetical protein
MTDEEIDMFLEWTAPRLMRGANPWERRFAFSIKMQAAKPRWRPSEKQVALMRKLMEEADDIDGGEVVE